MDFYLGCSGWFYRDWKERFYPEDLTQKEWLGYYAHRFGSVELNSTFYKTPKEDRLFDWKERTPEGFCFSVKGNRYVTHLKKLRDPEEWVKGFYQDIAPLGEKLGCVLWQLPGNLHKDMAKLERFCRSLDKNYRNVIEFRHISWYDDEVRSMLREHGVAFCGVSSSFGVPDTLEETASHAYIRFHGKGEENYKYRYDDQELEEWAEALKKVSCKEVFVYFNNDYYANAPDNCKTLENLLAGHEGSF